MPFQSITSTRDSGLELATSSFQLPNLRTLFPDLLESSPALASPAHSGTYKNPFDFHWNSKDLCSSPREPSDQASINCCKPGCNCDSNMLGDNIYFFSKRERLPSISSASSSPLLATPQSATAGLPAEFVEVVERDGFEPALSMTKPFSYLRKSDEFDKGIVDWAFSTAKRPISEPHSSAFQKYIQPQTRIPWKSESQRSLGPSSPDLLEDMAHSINKPTSTTIHKPYRCTYCGKRFARPSSLNTHIYSHTGEKPFECEEEGCNRRFSVLSNLRRHAKLHARSQRGRSHQSKSSISPMQSEPNMAYAGRHW